MSFELKVPGGKKYTPRKGQADIIIKKKVEPVPIEEVKVKPKAKREIGKKTNFTLLVTEQEEKILKAEANKESRGVAPFILRLLKNRGLFTDDDIFLGNKVTPNKIKPISIKLTDAEHKAIEQIAENEGRSKNQVVSMFLYQQLFKNELS